MLFPRLLIIAAFVTLLSLKAKGEIPFASYRNSDSAQISNFSMRLLLGTESYLENSDLASALENHALFPAYEELGFFVSSGVSLGIGLPKLTNLSVGMVWANFTSQTQFETTSQFIKYSKLNGDYWGLFLEYELPISKRFTLDLGFRFLHNRLNLDINESPRSNDPVVIFDGSSSLELEYKFNAINPYFIIDYNIIDKKYYSFSTGLTIDYKYNLPNVVWKAYSNGIFDDWTQKDGRNIVDLPFLGNHVIGMGLSFTLSIYF